MDRAGSRQPRTRHHASRPSRPCGSLWALGLTPLHIEWHKADITAPLGDCCTDCAADVWTSLCPVETRTTKHPTLCTRSGKIDAKPRQEFRASRRYLARFVAEYNEIMGHH